MSESQFERLKKIIDKLRDPDGGCPWDLKQTHKSLLKYLTEESYEFIHSVEAEDFPGMEEELGDVLLQILLHSKIAEENNKFSMDSVCQKIADKMVRRHPHVFGDKDPNIEVDEVLENWEKIKKEEKGNKGSEIDESYLNFPAMMSSYKVGAKTNKLGFDWDDPSQVSYKVEEEWQELKEEIVPPNINKERAKEELGDFLFSTVQLARHLDIDPEEALRDANKKFIKRFQSMESLIKSDNKSFEGMNQAQMDVYWDQAKSLEE